MFHRVLITPLNSVSLATRGVISNERFVSKSLISQKKSKIGVLVEESSSELEMLCIRVLKKGIFTNWLDEGTFRLDFRTVKWRWESEDCYEMKRYGWTFQELTSWLVSIVRDILVPVYYLNFRIWLSFFRFLKG